MLTAFQVIITGDQEVTDPLGGTGSHASGFGAVIFDSVAVTASYSFTIEGLDFGPVTVGLPQTPNDSLDDVTRVHFHTAASGVNGPIVFGQIDPAQDDDLEIVLNPDGSWTVSGVWEQSDANGSINNFATALGSATPGTAVNLYFNVHTNDFGGGEIRGQLVAIANDAADVVTGTAGNDLLPGLGGNDRIDGGKGKDILVGGAGDDLLTGGTGPDLFVAGLGHDIITDFKSSQDQIQLSQDPESVRQVGDDVVITLAGNNTVTLLGVKLSSLQADDISILA
jgi:serralysin